MVVVVVYVGLFDSIVFTLCPCVTCSHIVAVCATRKSSRTHRKNTNHRFKFKWRFESFRSLIFHCQTQLLITRCFEAINLHTHKNIKINKSWFLEQLPNRLINWIYANAKRNADSRIENSIYIITTYHDFLECAPWMESIIRNFVHILFVRTFLEPFFLPRPSVIAAGGGLGDIDDGW